MKMKERRGSSDESERAADAGRMHACMPTCV